MESVDRLQQRPEVQLAIGQLSHGEQTHAQICLRVMGPRMQVPCVVVLEEQAEVTLAPVPGNENLARLSTAHSHRDLERPLRMVPMADALGELIDELLRRDPAMVKAANPQRRWADVAAEPTQSTDAAPPAQASVPAIDGQPRLLLQALFDRAHRTPVQLTTTSGLKLLIDPNFHSAWLDRPAETLSTTIADEQIASAEPVGLGTFEERIGRGGGLYPIQIEQLCWLGSGTTGAATPLDRWLEDDSAVLRLQTWPNLSVQPDYAQWLQVLPAMWTGALSMEEAVRRLQDTGMAATRARYGMALLCLFRHAKRDTSQVRPAAAAPAPVVAAAPASPAASEKQGLLGRLKSRLRGMLG